MNERPFMTVEATKAVGPASTKIRHFGLPGSHALAASRRLIPWDNIALQNEQLRLVIATG